MMKWEMRRLDEICEVVGGTTPSTNNPEYWDGDIIWLSPVDLPEVGIISNVQSSKKQITDKALKECSLKLLPVGSLVYSTRASIGKIGIVNKKLVTNQGFTNFIPGNKINVKYLAYVLQHFTPTIESLGNSTTFKEVSRTAMRNFEIPLPPLHIQEQIANTLDKADALRRKDQELLTKYDELAQAIFYDMFGDPVKNEKGWPIAKLKDLIIKGEKINYGIVQPGEEFPDGIPIIRVGDFIDFGLKESGFKRVDPKIEKQFIKTRIIGDEILIGCVGSVGKVALVSEKHKGYNIVRATARVRPDLEKIQRLFLGAYLSLPVTQAYFSKETRTVSQPTLNITHIENTDVLLPPQALQKKYIKQVSNIFRQKHLCNNLSLNNEKLFEKIISDYFS